MDGSDRTPSASEPLAISMTGSRDLAGARAALRAWLRATIPEPQIEEILLASGEALANALEHGGTPVTLRAELDDGMLQLTVRDSGLWRRPADAPEQRRKRGLGIPIMTALSDRLTFETTDGTAVTLSRRFTT